jgi:glycosyltransferase involved in cell wall biosynthesis
VTGSPSISVVIPTFNRKDRLLECLRSLEAQTYPRADFDVCVVDDGSSDGTAEAVGSFASRTQIRVRFAGRPHEGPSAARNAGVDATGGDVIAFTEDDITLDPQWLEHAARYFLDPGTAVVEGRTRLAGSETLRSFERAGQPGFLPCNLFVRRGAFVAAGGFDPAYSDLSRNLYFREDADFGFRLLRKGYTAVYAPDVVVTHPAQFLTPGDVLRHVRRYLFDPLLYRNHPAQYRQYIEVKRLGPLVVHRPFHYLSWFYLAGFILILSVIFSHHDAYVPAVLVMLLLLHIGIRYRYERRDVPAFWNIPATAVYLFLPFYYFAWFLRGCLRFKSWRALL